MKRVERNLIDEQHSSCILTSPNQRNLSQSNSEIFDEKFRDYNFCAKSDSSYKEYHGNFDLTCGDECNQRNLTCKTDPVLCLCRMIFLVVEIFTQTTAEKYAECTQFQKQVLKQFLIRKFEFPIYYFCDDRLETDEPFDWDTVKDIAQSNSPNCGDEILNYVQNQFICFLRNDFINSENVKKIEAENGNQKAKHISEKSSFETAESDSIFLKKCRPSADFKNIKFEELAKNGDSEIQFLEEAENTDFESFIARIKSLPKIQKYLIKFIKNDMESPLIIRCNRFIESRIRKTFVNLCKLIRENKCTSIESGIIFVKKIIENDNFKLFFHVNDIRLIAFRILLEVENKDF